MIDESGMVEYLKLNRASDPRPELALAVVQALGGQYAFELLHDNITKHGVNKQLIKDEYGEFDRSWEQACLDIFNEHQEHCEKIVKAWYLEWGNGQDYIAIIQNLVNRDLAQECSAELKEANTSDEEYACTMDLLPLYSRDEVISCMGNDLDNHDTELRAKIAEKFIMCVIVIVSQYYAGYKETVRIRKYEQTQAMLKKQRGGRGALTTKNRGV